MIKEIKIFLVGIAFIGTIAFGGSQFIQHANRGDTPAPARDFIQYANRGDTPAPVIPTYTKTTYDSLKLS
ncbi:hypothetical protein [Bacillus thuringiensis]|uniref:hypothetical protein n=1 Tax=Bacillus thuringiensis TaxID=1428 RepID=UPI003F6BF7C0